MPNSSKGHNHSVEAISDEVFVTRVEMQAEPDDKSGRGKDPAASALGKKGGVARAAKMSPEQRAEIAKNAATKRWARRSE